MHVHLPTTTHFSQIFQLSPAPIFGAPFLLLSQFPKFLFKHRPRKNYKTLGAAGEMYVKSAF